MIRFLSTCFQSKPNAPEMPDAKKHADVPQPTHEEYPAIRNLLAITQVDVDKPFTYYFGACWGRSGDFTNHVQWEAYVKRFAACRDQPLQVTIERKHPVFKKPML